MMSDSPQAEASQSANLEAPNGERGNIHHNWRSWARLAFACAVIQTVFWAVLNPYYFNFQPTSFERFSTTNFQYAAMNSDDPAELAGVSFTPLSAGDSVCNKGYLALRFQFVLDQVPEEGLTYLGQENFDNHAVYINGALFQSHGSMDISDLDYYSNWKRPAWIPAALLHKGINQIDSIQAVDVVRCSSVVPSLIGGYHSTLKAFAPKIKDYSVDRIVSLGAGFVVSLFLFISLIRSEKRSLLFWLFVLTTSWTLRSLFYLWPTIPINGEQRLFFYFAIMLTLSMSWLHLVDEWTGYPIRLLQRVSYGLCTVSFGILVWALFGSTGTDIELAERLIDYVGLAYMAATALRLGWHAVKHREGRYWEFSLLILVAMLVTLQFVYLFIWDVQQSYMMKAQPFLILALVAAFFARNIRLYQSSAQINSILRDRLGEREIELATAHQRESQLVRKQAHHEERQRIMRDMHDGLGSQLMSMLLAAKRGHAEPDRVAEGLQSVIDEMRLMIGSMDSVGESLPAALNTFRERMQTRIKEAGFKFVWEDQYSDSLPNYRPREILQIFRVLQEAVTNALKHSEGTVITVTIKPGPSDTLPLSIHISDNGRWNNDTSEAGRGLDNMRTRAKAIGATLTLLKETTGTVVSLNLPSKK